MLMSTGCKDAVDRFSVLLSQQVLHCSATKGTVTTRAAEMVYHPLSSSELGQCSSHTIGLQQLTYSCTTIGCNEPA